MVSPFHAALAGGAALAFAASASAQAQTTPQAAPPSAAPDSAAPDSSGQDPDEAAPAPPPAAAPPSGVGDGNAIVVTATKREQMLQNVPVAVTVTTGHTLEEARILDIADLSTVVPALKVEQHDNAGEVNFMIRGFGNGAFNAGIEPSVGVFIDGVYRARAEEAISDFPDIDRIEVLRGPQSTLFGKNASAGVISITTEEPQFTARGSAEATYENYDGTVLKGMLTGPIGQTLALSVSAGYDHRRGYDYDAGTGHYLNNRNRWFARGQALWEPNRQLKVRLIADIDQIDELCCGVANVRASGATQIIEALGGKVNAAGNPFGSALYTDFDPTNSIRNYGFSGQVDYDLGPFKLTSITAWRKNRSLTNEDADFSSADILGTYAEQLRIGSFTQELRLATSLPGPLNFVAGGFYYDEHLGQTNQLSWGSQARSYFNGLIEGETAGLLGTPYTLGRIEGELAALTGRNLAGSFFGAGQYQDVAASMNDRSGSVFAQADYKPTARLTLTGGVNYTHDVKHYAIGIASNDVFSSLDLPQIVAGAVNAGVPAGQALPLLALMPLQLFPAVPGVPNGAEPGSTRDGDVTWTARAAYKAATHINIYANFSTGFKPSSINLSRNSRPALTDAPALEALGLAPPPSVTIAGNTIASSAYGSRIAGPEHSTLFEGGMKADWGKASLNLTLFKQIIRGFQYQIFTGTGFFLANAGQQSNWGIEADGALRPGHGLTLSAALDWYNPRYDGFTASSVGDLTGTTPAGIPPVTIDLAAEENHRLTNGDRLILRGDWHYESRYQLVEGFANEVTRNPITQAVISNAPGIALARQFTSTVSQFDASLTYAFARGIELMVWGRNLTDNRYLITAFDSPAQPGSISAYTSEPRTYGVTARVKW